ncbi:pirin family protein [bacterium]|nr:pirin family protein [bacterium]
MITVRPANERGHADHGWLDTYHTFSFAGYRDPNHMGFRKLRVINEDRVAPGQGFGTHPHNDMEIITYVLDGELEHKDSMGTGSVIRRGDIQRMSAGRGVMHSEFNHSHENPVHLVQIWLFPDKLGLTPEYEQKRFDDDSKRGTLRLLVSSDGREGSLRMHQDASLYASILEAGQEVTHQLAPGRYAWLQVVDGSVTVNNQRLNAGDGASIAEEDSLTMSSESHGEFLLFDLP